MKHRWFLLLAWFLLMGGMLLLRYIEPGSQSMPIGWEAELTQPLDPLGVPFIPPPPGLISSAAALGFLLIGAWMTGLIFRKVNLPKITGYLIFGVLVGPELYDTLVSSASFARFIPTRPLIPHETLNYMQLVNDLAISIIAFTAGGEIRLDALKRGMKHILSITLVGVVLVFLIITSVLLLFRGSIPLLGDQAFTVAMMMCMLIAIIAVANSPATVLAMIKETDAEGIMTQIALAVTVVKDLILVILFTILMAIALRVIPSGDDLQQHITSSADVLGHLAWHLIGSLIAGCAVGGLFRLAVRRMADHMAIFVIACGFGLALLSDVLGLEPLLVALVAGFVLANLWPRKSATMFHATEELSLPVYCLFFAVAGASIRIDAVIDLWLLALFIVALRGVLLWFTTWLGGTITRLENPARSWMWTIFTAQAGVSIALVTQISQSFSDSDGHSWSTELSSLLLAVIALHQLIGPPLMRFGLIKAGEISRK